MELNAVAFPVAVGFSDVAVAADYPEIQVVLIPAEVQVRRDFFHLFILSVVPVQGGVIFIDCDRGSSPNRLCNGRVHINGPGGFVGLDRPFILNRSFITQFNDIGRTGIIAFIVEVSAPVQPAVVLMILVANDSEQVDGILFACFCKRSHVVMGNGHHHVDDAVLCNNLLFDVLSKVLLIIAVAAHAKLSEFCLTFVVYILFRAHSQAKITEAAV